MTTKQFYVYKLIDPSIQRPFYIGKGRGDRMFQHERARNKIYKTATHNNLLLKNKINKVIRECGYIRYQQHFTSTETNAFNIECALIKRYGRRDNATGILCNMTNGGEGVSGHVRSTLWRQKNGQRQISHSKGYDQYTINGEFVYSYQTVEELRQAMKTIDTGALSFCVNNKIRSTGGYRWTWKGHQLQPWCSVPRPQSNGICVRSKTINQYTKNGLLIASYPSLTLAGKAISKHPNTLLECCKGRSRTAGRYVWEYA